MSRAQAKQSIYFDRGRDLRQWLRSGELMVWINAAAVTFSVLAVVSLVGLLAWQGLGHFWPRDLLLFEYREGDSITRVLAQRVSTEQVARDQLVAAGVELVSPAAWHGRSLVKRGNRERTDTDFVWLLDERVLESTRPPDAIQVEREEWGDFYGELLGLLDEGRPLPTGNDGDATWRRFQALIDDSRSLRRDIHALERDVVGGINYRMERLRLRERRRSLEGVPGPHPDIEAERETLAAEYERVREQLRELYRRNARYSYEVGLADGERVILPVGKVIRAIRPNRMSTFQKLDYYRGRLWEFLTEQPREANTEGGVYPAIFGTVLMVILMSIVVTPLGVIAAVYLHEVGRQGRVTRVFRAAVNNLAGVPSIVWGIFGLGFFVYGVGGEFDRLFFPEALPSPTYGTPGIMWASLTLALLTLPVVIVATEEGLARIPMSIREGSLALGATRAETLWRVVLPMASPAMMTGVILAVARAAGEVAPLMLVGVVKLAPTLPLDGNFPYLHLEQKFMHLGFHIYDVGFQSPNIEAARPLVYATALLLVVIIALLNLLAVGLRNRLRERYLALES